MQKKINVVKKRKKENKNIAKQLLRADIESLQNELVYHKEVISALKKVNERLTKRLVVFEKSKTEIIADEGYVLNMYNLSNAVAVQQFDDYEEQMILIPKNKFREFAEVIKDE